MKSRLALAVALATTGCQSGIDTTVTIDPTETHQTIVAWEATARLWEFDKDKDRFDGSWIAHRDQILDYLVTKGGINRIRLELKSGVENPVDYWTMFERNRISYSEFRSHFYEKINDDSNPGHINPAGFQFSELDFKVKNILLPAIDAAKRHNKRLTINLNFVDFGWTDRKGTLSFADEPAEYAELIVAALQHLKRRWGLTPDALEIILEPDNTDGWHGEQIGRAIVETARRLKLEGIALPQIIAPSTAQAKLALPYLDEILRVKGALPLLGTISYHRYDTLPSKGVIAQIGAKAKAFGKQTAMLEHVEGDANELFEDLIEGDVSAWQQYGIAWNGIRSGHLLKVDIVAKAPPIIHLTPVGLHLAELFTHVQPGAVRIGASANAAGVVAVAFRNPDGGEVLLIRPTEASGNTRWSRLMRMVTPARDYHIRLAGLGRGRYIARLMRGDGQVQICAWDGHTPLNVRSGSMLTVAAVASNRSSLPAPCGEEA